MLNFCMCVEVLGKKGGETITPIQCTALPNPLHIQCTSEDKIKVEGRPHNEGACSGSSLSTKERFMFNEQVFFQPRNERVQMLSRIGMKH